MTDEVVHQTKELKGRELVTKCGIAGKAEKIAHSAWHSDVTCEDCLEGVDE